MVYNFEKALKSGVSSQEITNYLTSVGREKEALDYFGIKKPQGLVDTLKTGAKELVSDIKKRGDNVMSQANRNQSVGEDFLQLAGQTAGAAGDIISNVAKTTYKALPDSIEKPITDTAKDIGVGILQTPIGQEAVTALQGGMEMYNDFKTKNPRAAANIEAVLNIGSIIPVTKGAQVAGKTAVATTKLVGEGLDLGFDATKKATSATGDLLGKGLEKTGQKIQNSVIKPSTADISDGFKVENVNKYDLGGDLPTTITKGHVKMNELTQELQKKLEGSTNAVNLNSVVEQTKSKLLSNKGKTFGDNQAIERVIESLQTEVSGVSGPNGLVDLVEATNVKRGAGSKGAWAYNRPEADATAIEKVYTQFYNELKNEIEKQAPEGVKEINKQLSEIIPIYTAAIRRLPVEQRNNALSITDNLGLFSAIFDPKALAVLGATKAAKSGKVGNALVKLGGKLKK
jgi:hypothetical protein